MVFFRKLNTIEIMCTWKDKWSKTCWQKDGEISVVFSWKLSAIKAAQGTVSDPNPQSIANEAIPAYI